MAELAIDHLALMAVLNRHVALGALYPAAWLLVCILGSIVVGILGSIVGGML